MTTLSKKTLLKRTANPVIEKKNITRGRQIMTSIITDRFIRLILYFILGIGKLDVIFGGTNAVQQ